MEYEHFNINLVTKDVTESSTKNLIPIPHECEVASENGRSLSSSEADSDGGVIGLAVSLPLFLVVALDLESDSHQEEIDVVSVTNDVLPPSDDDSDEEVDAVDVLRIDNFIQNSKHEYSEIEYSDFDNPPLPLPPPEPPDKGFNFEKEISVEFSLLFAESEDTIFDPG
nr:hypothetical protein [Tanacetum cinerariifolium]